METNQLYNLMHEFVNESKALWHMRQFYLKDATCHGECKQYWEDVIANKEKHLNAVKQMLKSHM